MFRNAQKCPHPLPEWILSIKSLNKLNYASAFKSVGISPLTYRTA